jgi:hypothetical protein
VGGGTTHGDLSRTRFSWCSKYGKHILRKILVVGWLVGWLVLRWSLTLIVKLASNL